TESTWPGWRRAFFLTGTPSKVTRPSSSHRWAAERVTPSRAAASTASARPASGTFSGKVASVVMGLDLLLLVELAIEEQYVDHQQNHAHREAGVGHVEDGKVDERGLEHVGDIAQGHPVDEIAHPAGQH